MDEILQREENLTSKEKDILLREEQLKSKENIFTRNKKEFPSKFINQQEGQKIISENSQKNKELHDKLEVIPYIISIFENIKFDFVNFDDIKRKK